MTLPDPPKLKGRKPSGKPHGTTRTFRQPLEVWESFDKLPGQSDAERFRNLIHGASKKSQK